MTPASVAPLVISASRATDLPAFHSGWFMERLREGTLHRRNPFNGQSRRIILDQVRLIVFWSKNPAPLIPHLAEIADRGIACYFQFTLNDYGKESLEPGLPSLSQRVETFLRLSEMLPPGAVVWRFDPVILSASITPEIILEKIGMLAAKLHNHTEKLVFSFFDLYNKVKRRLDRLGITLYVPTPEEEQVIVKGLAAIGAEKSLKICSCAESLDYSLYGVQPNSCIDPDLITRLCPDLKGHPALFKKQSAADLFNSAEEPQPLKDKGQRRFCRCVPSQDIGAYNTCRHGCVYCYAER